MPSLALKDIERGLGGDLLRRPIVTSMINAIILRMYYDSVLELSDLDVDDEQESKENKRRSQFLDLSPPKPGSYEYEQFERQKRKHFLVENLLATCLFILTHIIQIIGLAETIVWLIIAISFKLFSLPKIYTLEKLLLDIRALILPVSVKHIDRNVSIKIHPLKCPLPKFKMERRGFAYMPITVIFFPQTSTAASESLLKLLHFVNFPFIMYWMSDTVVVAGRCDVLVNALCSPIDKPVNVDLGWHRDVIEHTTYKLSVTFIQESFPLPLKNISQMSRSSNVAATSEENSTVINFESNDGATKMSSNCENMSNSNRNQEENEIGSVQTAPQASRSEQQHGGNNQNSVITLEPVLLKQSSPLQIVAKNVVKVQLEVEAGTSMFEMLLQSMDQFGTVCEAPEPGKRQFNGKRFAIFGIGVAAAVLLVLYYQDYEFTNKPEIDVLTLSFGVYTLWMTVGKSAVFGEVEEETLLNTTTRGNILMAFHGLAILPNHIVNVCWVPELYRRDRKELNEDEHVVDGSISLLEAAIFLNIYQHYGHFIKWKGPRLSLDRYDIRLVKSVDDDDDDDDDDDSNTAKGIGHVIAVDRFSRLGQLKYIGESSPVKRIG